MRVGDLEAFRFHFPFHVVCVQKRVIVGIGFGYFNSYCACFCGVTRGGGAAPERAGERAAGGAFDR